MRGAPGNQLNLRRVTLVKKEILTNTTNVNRLLGEFFQLAVRVTEAAFLMAMLPCFIHLTFSPRLGGFICLSAPNYVCLACRLLFCFPRPNQSTIFHECA